MSTSIVFISDNYLAFTKLCYELRQNYTVLVQETTSIQTTPLTGFHCAIIDYTSGKLPLKEKPPIFTIGLVQDTGMQAVVQLLKLTDLTLSSETTSDDLHPYLQPTYQQFIQTASIPTQSSVLLIGDFADCLSKFNAQLLPFNCIHAPTPLLGITHWRNHTKSIHLVIVDHTVDDPLLHHEFQFSYSTIIVYHPHPNVPTLQYFERGYHGIIGHPNDLIPELLDIATMPKPMVSSQQNATFIMEDIHQKRTKKLTQDYQRLPAVYQETIQRSMAIPRIEATTFKDTLNTLCQDTGHSKPIYQPQPVLFIGDALKPVVSQLNTQRIIPSVVPTIEAAMSAIKTTDFSAIVTPIMLPDGMIHDWLGLIYEHLFIRNIVAKTIVINHDHRLKTKTQLMRRHVNYQLQDPVGPNQLLAILEPWAIEFFYIQSCYTLLDLLINKPLNQPLKSALYTNLDPVFISLL